MMAFSRPRPATSARALFALAAFAVGHASAGSWLFGCPADPSLTPAAAPSVSVPEPLRIGPPASAKPPIDAERPAADT